ncbi:unnamed protein product [Parascedosporium putredinis]|uniref:Nucleolar protein NOP52 variant n=1 Tax=Parascedosporium putredinis TaxID=1442378 RepID=A0A9P1M8Y4_9PEZI|nr:unnamed protein product [Parascedosporium putredinis]CAI7989783.1 unnamed protein product [Parascedosporium putredinis]
MADANLPFIRNLASSASSQSSSQSSSSAGAVHPDCADAWMSAFWQVHAAEWTTGIDVLRMEKFLLLVRRFLCASFSWVRASAYDPARARALLSVLADWPLTTDRGLDAVPLGLRLHVLDVWVDELERAGVLADAAGGDDENDETSPVDPAKATALVDSVGALVRILTKDVPSKPLRTKASNSLDDERLPWYKAPNAADEEGDDDGWAGFQD